MGHWNLLAIAVGVTGVTESSDLLAMYFYSSLLGGAIWQKWEKLIMTFLIRVYKEHAKSHQYNGNNRLRYNSPFMEMRVH